MAVILLDSHDVTAKTVRAGSTEKTLDFPSHVKCLTTGAGSETVFDDGPANGKQWVVRVDIQIVETDA